MNDDSIDQRIRDGVRDYNEPGATPRDVIWARIAESRGDGRRLAQRRLGRIWVWSGMGIAAAVLLAVGVMMGRRMEHISPLPAPRQSVAIAPAVPASPPQALARAASDSGAEILREVRRQTQATNRRARNLVAVDAQAGAPDGRASTDATDMAYHLVVLQHLAGSEALITSFRSSAGRGEVDTQLAAWSREMLSTTRLLEATAVTRDPTMRRLLEDLDLVISQIVQYVARGTNNSDDLDLIEQSINKRGVLPKLRGTIPVRNLPAGT